MNFKGYKEYFKDKISLIDEAEVISFIDLLQKRELYNIYTIGNGGSYSTASHFAQDLTKACGYTALCLMDNTSMLTAYSNDDGYDKALANIILKYGMKEDVLIAISGSGNSPNIINAAKIAHRECMFVVGITGFDGGKLKDLADLSIHIPLDDMATVESIHSMILHYVTIKLKK
jgi:D-sedoheptulose 7-phosphate isomerase